MCTGPLPILTLLSHTYTQVHGFFSLPNPRPCVEFLRDPLTLVYPTTEYHTHQYPPHAHVPRSHMHTRFMGMYLCALICVLNFDLSLKSKFE